jgi:hypothetical protein
MMSYILDTSCSRKSLSSTIEQQDAADGGEDDTISGDTSIMPYSLLVETWRKSLFCQSSRK